MTRYKYPRTPHLPWSESITNDDKIIKNLDMFYNTRVIVSIKMDGENTTLSYDYIHARSLESISHPSQTWIKNFWSNIKNNIPIGWRICGENLFAKHSIQYNDLKSYFYGFSIWNDINECLSWDDTLIWFELLNITPVTVIYDDIFDEQKIKNIWKEYNPENTEGYVIRISDSFNYKNFNTCVAKYVRKNHVQTNKHWKNEQIIKNKLI